MSKSKALLSSKKFWLNVVTFVLVIALLIATREQLWEAVGLLGQVNLLILALLIPVQIFSYYANGMMFFAYLRGRNRLKHVSHGEMTKVSLELNFVNHVFPSGGISGMGYMLWRLKKLGVTAGQATMSQIIRQVTFFVAFVVLLAVSLIFVTVDAATSNWIVLITSVLVTSVVALVVFATYLLGNRKRIISFAHWLTRVINKLVYLVTFHRKENFILRSTGEKFFGDIFDDFQVIKAQKTLLIKPMIWAFVFVVADVSLFLVAFYAFGDYSVNPALLLIAYGAAAVAGMFMLTPGGAGAYEAIMISILVAGGTDSKASLAAVILTRVILILGTLATGYVVYHQALRKYGKPILDTKIDLTPDDEIASATKSPHE
jgi:uncharacterized protein (TIRG00374 family)